MIAICAKGLTWSQDVAENLEIVELKVLLASQFTHLWKQWLEII